MKTHENTPHQEPRDSLKDLDFLTLCVKNGQERQHVRDVNLVMAQRPRLRSPDHKAH